MRKSFVMLLAMLAGQALYAATPVSGVLYYTRWASAPSVSRTAFRFDGASLTIGVCEDLALVRDADGIIFDTTGRLIVGGGESNEIYRVQTKLGRIYETRSAPGVGAYHLAMDPDQRRAWAGALPGPLLEIPLSPFGDAVARPLLGDNIHVTGIAFDSYGQGYYTASGSGGIGDFGVIDFTTFTTVRKLTLLPAAHGIIFDRFSNTLILAGSKHVSQIDPITLTVISDLDLTLLPALNSNIPGRDLLDQLSSTGKGHVLVAVNNGNLVLIDMSASRRVADPSNVVVSTWVDTSIDDIAPLTWLGAPAPPLPPHSGSSAISPRSLP